MRYDYKSMKTFIDNEFCLDSLQEGAEVLVLFRKEKEKNRNLVYCTVSL